LNEQPIEKRESLAHPSLDIVSLFLTVQGEGPFSGQKAVFLRLAGCNLQCPGCDTNYTSGRSRKTYAEIIETISTFKSDFRNKKPLLVITGGEPFRQRVELLINSMIDKGWIVQVETNGSFFPEGLLHNDVHVVCSPKTPNINRKWHDMQNFYLKYVIKHGDIDSEPMFKAFAILSMNSARQSG